MTASAEQLIRRFESLRSLRRPHDELWRECYDYTYPLRGRGFTSGITNASEGLARRASLLDSTATDSVRVLASAIMGGLTPANSRWFTLDIGDESEDERRWLDESADTLWQNIHASNFDAAAFEACIDVICAGSFALYADENPREGGLRFQQWPLSSVYTASTNPKGSIDTVYRSFSMTAEQAVGEFGDADADSGVSEKTEKLAKDKPDEKVEFVHAIYPRAEKKGDVRMRQNLPIASVHVEVGAKRIVRESGYHEMPVIVPRWMLIPDTAYGVGPVFDALPDIKMLNELKKMELASADLAIAGMWIAEDDGVLNPRTVKVGPRKIIIANSVDSMKPLQTGTNFQLSDVLVNKLQGAIRKVLMADQLQPQDGPSMTATEVHVRVAMVRQLLGPVYGRLQAEYLSPLIKRSFGLAYRAGVFGAAPESLSGREFSVKYISPMARAQQMEEVTAIERLGMSAAQIAQIRPEVLDLIDYDASVRMISDALGVPPSLIRSSRAVKRIRSEREEQQQVAEEQQKAAQMEQMAGEALMKKAANE